jgi:hypothetical protein
MPVVGWLDSSTLENRRDWVLAFRQGLSEVGCVPGQNVAIDYRWAENQYDRLPALALFIGRASRSDIDKTDSCGDHWLNFSSIEHRWETSSMAGCAMKQVIGYIWTLLVLHYNVEENILLPRRVRK